MEKDRSREVARYFKLQEEKLTGKRTGHRDERGVAMELMYRYGGVSQAEIGKVLGNLDYTFKASDCSLFAPHDMD